MHDPALSIVIPAFNASHYLAERVSFLQNALNREGRSSEIIIVDDGSTDETWYVMQRLDVDRVRMPHNRGKFAAIRAGMQRARGQCCAFIDADVPFDPSVLRTMFDLIVSGGAHLTIGDRTLASSSYSNQMTPSRRLATIAFRQAVRWLVTDEYTDTQCGVKAFRADVARALFAVLQEEGFAGDVELLHVAAAHDLRVERVPVHLIHRGTSSLRLLHDGAKMLRSLAAIRARSQTGAYDSAALRTVSHHTTAPAARPIDRPITARHQDAAPPP